ncbi:MAG: hypothetical protein AAFN92_04245, partial [Bacteroidota bacterium]
MQRVVLTVIFLALAIGARAQRCGFTDTLAIGAFGETDVTISIANYLNNDLANGNQGLCNVTLYFQHSYVYDLTVTLTSPVGQSVQLIGPINAQTRPPTNLARWFVDFASCDSTTVPDPGAPPVWNNNSPFNWNAFGVYTGIYHPATGCFADIDTGPINGDWTLTFNTERTGQQGRLIYVLLEFCDDRNSEGPCCFANAGDLRPEAPLEACEEIADFPLDLPPRYRQPRPSAEQYGYTYAIARNDSVLFLQDEPNLAGMPAGEYEVCGLSYRRGELDQLPLDGTFSIADLRQDFAAVQPTLCADLTNVCQRVTLRPIPDTTFLERRICDGGSVSVGNNTFTATDVYAVTLPGRAGCDSVVILDLEVVDELLETVDTTICAEGVFRIGTREFDLPGSYRDTILSVLGCDSIVVLNLDVAPPIVVDTAAAICAGETFFIGSEAFTTETTVSRTIVARNGCDSTVNLDLIVLDPVIMLEPVPAGLDCDTPNLTLDATNSNLAFTESIRWLDTLGNVLREDLTLAVDTAGVYILELVAGIRGTSCAVRDTVTLADFRFPINANGARPQVPGPFLSCGNPTLELRAEPAPVGPAYAYAWTAPPDGNIVGPTDGAGITIDAPGRYNLRISDPATGCLLDTFYLVELDTLQPRTNVTGNALLNCVRSEIDLLADTTQERLA